MEKQITKITTETTGNSAFITVIGDKETVAKITSFVANLSAEINTPKNDTHDDKR